MKRIFGGGGGGAALWKPKNPHSLEYLKYLHGVLEKNDKVTGGNRALVVEALRAIAEILIWGDQNDSTVFDFFLEKQMLSFFLSIMGQKCGGRVTVQLLQTLNIMFENIRHETSLYFLLSNNHVNSIISHPFDFDNEEIMAYYISFLRTLSLKLNAFTIHFFFDDKTAEFPLYTEALRFYDHPEGMVRIAVRTITLSVYRLRDPMVLKFNVESGMALGYFTNLVAHVKNQIVAMDTYLHCEHDSPHCMGRLTDFIDEHLDNILYINDILKLELEELNGLLVGQLMRRLFLPIYLGSLAPELQPATLHVSRVTSLFLLSHVFLTITYTPLVEQLLTLLLFGDGRDLSPAGDALGDAPDSADAPALSPGPDTSSDDDDDDARGFVTARAEPASPAVAAHRDLPVLNGVVPLRLSASDTMSSLDEMSTVARRPLFASLLGTLDCAGAFGDHETVFAVILFYAIGRNKGAPAHLLEAAQLPPAGADCSCSARSAAGTPSLPQSGTAGNESQSPSLSLPSGSGGQQRQLLRRTDGVQHQQRATCDRHVVDRLVRIVVAASLDDCVRAITVQLCCLLLRQMILTSDSVEHECGGGASACASTADLTASGSGSSASLHANRSPQHTSFWGRSGRLSRSLYQAKQNLAEHLADVYRGGEAGDLVDAFEYQYDQMQRCELRPDRLAADARLLIAPQSAYSARRDVAADLRQPLDDDERVQRNVHLLLLVRQFLLDLHGRSDECLPMSGPKECVRINDCFDLSKCDILACTVIVKSRGRTRSQRYLVTDELQLILVEPDDRKLGFGVAQFVAWLQDVEIAGDKDDPRSLRVTIRAGPRSAAPPRLVAKFVFDDHIRCMAARQRLVKGRQLARQYKMDIIGDVLGVARPDRRGGGGSQSRGGNSHAGKLPGYARALGTGTSRTAGGSAGQLTGAAYHKGRGVRTAAATSQRRLEGSRRPADASAGSSSSSRARTPNTSGGQHHLDDSADSIQLDELEPALRPVESQPALTGKAVTGGVEARFVPVTGSGKAKPIREL